MKKHIKLLAVLGIILVGSFSFYLFKGYKKDALVYENNKIKPSSSGIAMMLETSAGSGNYEMTTRSEWPTEGYVFNANLSKCENGSELSWDNENKKVLMSGNKSDKCYVYFDVYVPPAINEVCSNGDTMSNCIKKLYTKQGENNLYLHDSTLTNGAKDNSYRYAGSSETTNNFVCFGYDSQDGSCPNDNLYRIIGVFDGEVKLIKYDYAKSTLLGTDGDYYNTYSGAGWSSSSYGTNKGQNSKSEIGVYYWNNNTRNNTWSESRLNTINLNKNYINNIGTKWSEKISTHTWKIGGNTWSNIGEQTAPTAYQNEINSPATNKTVNAKVGLMYVSDYGYAASSSSWSTALSSYNNANVTANNWMYMGLYEWTLAPQTDRSDYAFRVSDAGRVYGYGVNHYGFAARPVLYLKSTIGYGGGSGTAAKPILVN